MRLINVGLISRWENWIIVLLTLLIATVAVNSLSKLVQNKDGVN